MAKQPGLTIPDLKARLDGGVAPVYLLAGSELFLADEARRAIVNAVRARSGGCSVSSFDGSQAALSDVLDTVRTQDLFSPARLAVVSGAGKFIQTHAEPLVAYAADPPKDGHLVLVVEKVDARRKLVKTVRELGGLVACNPLYPRQVPPWLVARAKSAGLQIDTAAAALLADFLGTGLGALAGEIEKLAAYLKDRTRITADDVQTVSLRDHGRVIFELGDAIGQRDAARVLTVLDKLLEQGEKPARIVYHAARHLRRLWSTKELTGQGIPPQHAARKAGVHFFVDEFLRQVNTFSLTELRRNSSMLTRCEAALKTSAMDERVLLETTFIRLVQSARRRTA